MKFGDMVRGSVPPDLLSAFCVSMVMKPIFVLQSSVSSAEFTGSGNRAFGQTHQELVLLAVSRRLCTVINAPGVSCD